jgi:hypothetical protein
MDATGMTAWLCRRPKARGLADAAPINTIAGASLRADVNSSLTRIAPMPTYSSTNSDALMEKKGTPASPATARASSVLPGGDESSECVAVVVVVVVVVV